MGKKSTKNVERPQSAQELQLLETQNIMTQKGIATAAEQEARAKEQHQIWKDSYMPMETRPAGSNPQAEAMYAKRLDNQMPRYAEDTSGVRTQSAQPMGTMQQPKIGAKGGR